MKKLYTHHSIYLLFAVCWLSYFSAYLGRLNFTACIAAINEAENLSKLELGRVSSAFFVCYGGAQLFSGLLADRLRPRLLVAVGLLGGAAVNVGMAVSGTAGQMAVLWAVNGLLQSLVWTPMIKSVADLTQDAQCARTCLNLSTTTPAGTLGAYLMCVLCVASPWGWRLSFWLGGAAMAAGGARVDLRHARAGAHQREKRHPRHERAAGGRRSRKGAGAVARACVPPAGRGSLGDVRPAARRHHHLGTLLPAGELRLPRRHLHRPDHDCAAGQLGRRVCLQLA